MTTYGPYSITSLVGHAEYIGRRITKIEDGSDAPPDEAAVAEIDTLMGKLTVLRGRLTGQSGIRTDFMRAPIDELTIEELRERHRRAWDQWMAELKTEREAAHDYWAKACGEEAAALQRVRDALFANGLKKSIPTDVIEQALNGE